MGAVNFSRIPTWNPDIGYDLDVSVPIGESSLVENVSLTEIVIRDSSASAWPKLLDFGAERDGFQIWKNRPLDIRSSRTPVDKGIRLTTLEISIERIRKDWVKGKTAVASYKPYSLDWFGWSTFKAVTHHPRSEFMEKLLDSVASLTSPGEREAAVWSRMQQIKSDVFGADDRYCARFRQFDRTDYIGDPFENNFNPGDREPVTADHANRSPRQGFHDKKTGQELEKPKLMLALCRDFDQCRKLLHVSELLTDTLDRVAEGTIEVDDVPFKLSGAAISLAGPLLTGAICKALAGPSSNHRRLLEPSPLAKKFGDVAVLAYWIFLESLVQLHRRTNEEGPVTIKHPDQRGTSDEGGQTLGWSEIDIEGVKSSAPTRAAATREEIQNRLNDCASAFESGLGKRRTNSTIVRPEVWLTLLGRFEHALEQTDDPDWDRHHRQSVEETLMLAAVLMAYPPVPETVLDAIEKLRLWFPLYVEVALGEEWRE